MLIAILNLGFILGLLCRGMLGANANTNKVMAYKYWEAGLSQMKDRSYEKALESFEKSLQFEPDIPGVHRDIAECLIICRDDDYSRHQAVSHSLSAIYLNSKSNWKYFQTASNAYERIGALEAAAYFHNLAYNEAPEDVRLRLRKGN